MSAIKPKNQRLVLLLLALAAIVGAGVLALSGLKSQASFFYAPADIAGKPLPLGKHVRLGGMVQNGSLKKLPDGVSIAFVVTDDSPAKVPVLFKGVAPDLFREGSGVVAEGQFQPDGSFVATELLAKHDEKYMPPQVAGKMHKSESLEQ